MTIAFKLQCNSTTIDLFHNLQKFQGQYLNKYSPGQLDAPQILSPLPSCSPGRSWVRASEEHSDYDAHDHQTDEGPIGEYVDNV